MAATSILETAGFVDVTDRHQILRDQDWRRGIHHTRVVNGSNRTRPRYVLRWNEATRGQAAALRDHYEANAAAGGVPFDYARPGGSAEKVLYRDRPRISRQTATSFAMQAVLEKAHATD